MLIFGDVSTNKTDILIENYARLLNSGICADDILVIVQNSKMKSEFIEKTKKLLTIDAVSKFSVYTFFGLCYNFILDYYPILENKINSKPNLIAPNMCGLEVSKYIFKNAIDKLTFKGYNSKVNLLHQLLRRQSLITLNALSDEEISEKTKILMESFTFEIKNAINLYKYKTLEYRAFDYLRQVQLFSFIYKNINNPYKYVFIDDADEITPSLFEYLKYIKPNVKEFFIAYDKNGTSRKGYLCACENNFELFLNETPKLLPNNEIANSIFEKIKNNEKIKLENSIKKDFISASEMHDYLIKDVNNLINNGAKPDDILIIIPEDDTFLKLYLNKIEAKINFITGNMKLVEDNTVGCIISMLEILIQPIGYKISPYKLRAILGQILNVELNDAIKISIEFESDFECIGLFSILEKYSKCGKIKLFLELKEQLQNEKLSSMCYAISKNFLDKNTDTFKINQFMKQLIDFENIFKNKVSKQELLFNLKNTIISENPLGDTELIQNALNVSTLQKAIDLKLKNKYLFFVDCTNSNYTKQDIGPLYNAWVFSKNWNKSSFALNDNIILSLDKIARQIRKLYLLNNGKIYFYSCIYNFLGIENFRGIKHFFDFNEKEKEVKFNIVPRDDQKPVLEYKNGKFAVMAVAGAGKTTIMLALIMKLLANNTKPENIFVITYMDSAARTFKERIKSYCPNLEELPNISTIHGLCMRILKENNNHAHLGLDVDFDIIDEFQRNKLISEILYNEGLDSKFLVSYEKGISAYKNSSIKQEYNLKPTFKRIYTEYQKSLKSLNLIDYDDLLLCALNLLKMNSKIREYYQNLCHFIIEDEAQDSSSIQQELINIISKKYGNIIRCGDVNQAITSTFTNSDVSGFKKFIESNPNCKMNYTARNSIGIINLANKLIQKGSEISNTSFFKIKTMPIKNVNLDIKNAINIKVFDFEDDEKKYILDKIKNIYQNEKTFSIGILTRTNKEAESFSEYIKNLHPEYKIITESSFNSNIVFKTILKVFNIISNPLNNNFIRNFLKDMIEMGYYIQDVDLLNKDFTTPFILNNMENYALWWDLRYFIELSILPPYELAFKIGEFYFSKSKINNMNIVPIASLVSKIYNLENSFEATLNKLNELSKKPISQNIKLYEEENEEKREIKILTLHKSKGDEYDYTFIPNMHKINLGLKPEDIKIKESTKNFESIINSKKKEEEIKQEIIDENFRLLYVGITRAKKKLFITSSREYKIFNKKTKVEPSCAIDILKGENYV